MYRIFGFFIIGEDVAMEQNRGLCGVWSTPALTGFNFQNYGTHCYSPRVLGAYIYFGDGVMPNLDNRVRVKLTSWIVNQRKLLKQKSSAENGIPELCPEAITEAQQRADLTVRERAAATIEFLRSNSSELGTVLTIPRFHEEDASLPLKELENKYEVLYRLLCVSECADEAELEMVLNCLYRRKDIEYDKSDSGFKVMI